MDSTDKLLQGLQNINAGGNGDSKPLENFFTLGEAAQKSGDFDKALKYYHKTADSDDGNAMFRLGRIYLKGFGYQEYNVAYNSDLGIEWMRRAGKAGNIEAMKYLPMFTLSVSETLPTISPRQYIGLKKQLSNTVMTMP